MCLGKERVLLSYRGTRFFEYDSQTFSLRGGDYEKNDGTGASIIITKKKDRYGDDFEEMFAYKPPAGTLTANDGYSTKFEIRMSGRHDGRDFNAFEIYRVLGYAQEGVYSLKNLIATKGGENLIVKDCGALISMN